MSKSKEFVEKQLQGLSKEDFNERLVEVLKYFSTEDTQIEEELQERLNKLTEQKEENNG